MYVASANGVTWYDGIDRKDLNNIKLQIVSKDLMNYTLSLNNIDCNSKGKIAFDAKNMNGQHFIKCYHRNKIEEKYDFQLEGDKKMVKFFRNYIIEVKTEAKMDKIQIYDFDNKLSLFST